MRRFLLLAGLCLGCTTKTRETPPAPSVSQPMPQALQPFALDEAARLPPDLSGQVAWQLAERQDPMNLAVLANQLGAGRLAALVAEGGRAGVIALAAFEHAPDAHAERALFCRMLPRLATPFRQRGLASLERIVQLEPWGEQLEPQADAQCQRELAQLRGADLSPAERDLVDSAEQRLHAAPRHVGD